MESDKKGQIPLTIKESGWTVEEYLQLPEDGNQYEIVGGKLELRPSPTTTQTVKSEKARQVMTKTEEVFEWLQSLRK
jgi:hypothetical protein